MNVDVNRIFDQEYLDGNLIELADYFSKLNSSKSPESDYKELAWACLAKIVYQCEPSRLKSISSRLQKRLIDSSKQPLTIALLHFLRALLKKLPWLKSSNAETFSILVANAIDLAVETNGEEIILLATDIFVLFAEHKFEKDLLTALNGALVDSLETEVKLERIKLSSWKMQSNRSAFIKMAFRIHSAVIENHHPDTLISVSVWLSHADDALSLNIPEVNEEVFGWLKKIIKHTGLAVLNISDHIINLLTQYCRPSTNFYSCVRALAETGLSSSGSSFIKIIAKSAESPLHLQDYGEAFADAVSSFLIYRTSVWNVHDVKELQQWICHEVLLNPDSIPALRILIALLACNHELVPIPIEVAQNIFWRSTDDERIEREMERGRILCNHISRPCMTSVLQFKNWLIKYDSDGGLNDSEARDTIPLERRRRKRQEVYMGEVNQNTLKIAKYSIDERKKTAEADQTGTYENFAHITNSSNFNGKDKSKQEDFAVNLISNNVDPIDIIIIESDVAKNKASSHPNQNARTVGNCNSDAMPRKGQTVITSTDGNEISVEQMLADFDPS